MKYNTIKQTIQSKREQINSLLKAVYNYPPDNAINNRMFRKIGELERSINLLKRQCAFIGIICAN